MPADAIFHQAVQVTDLAATKAFYGDLLGCAAGRRADDPVSVDFEFFGHHLVCHLAKGDAADRLAMENRAADLRHRHFGAVMAWDAWEALLGRVRGAGVEPLFPVQFRHLGQPGEEGFFMLRDPSGHVLEFKTFRDLRHLFIAP